MTMQDQVEAPMVTSLDDVAPARVNVQSADRSRTRGTPRQWSFAVFVSGVSLVLFFGWVIRKEEILTAESGLGYALGIIGACMMLLLLVYPLRKRIKFLRGVGGIKFWFQFHMMLGVLGPTLILFHSNFGLGSLNSNVALWSMLVVAASGIVGRYFYSRIHMGLHGRQATIEELNEEAEASVGEVSALFAFAPEVRDRLLRFGLKMLERKPGLMASFFRYIFVSIQAPFLTYFLRRRIFKGLKAEAVRAGWSRRDHKQRRRAAGGLVKKYIGAVRRAAEFKLFERLFALWHVFHLPLFFMLVIAGIVHVLAVHMY